jgi:hypothetical protein
MRTFIVSAAAVAVVFVAVWFVSSNPHAKERLETDARSIKMDIDAMTRKARNLPVTVVENYM